MAIQDDNTILMKLDLKAYHEKIAPMLGGSFMMSTNVGDYYSTDEKIVGVWTDNKPLYQKTFVSTLPTLTTTGEVKKDITIGASVDNIVNIYGCFNYYNTNNMIMIPYNSDIGSVYLFGRPNNTSTTASKNTIGITANPKTVDAASRLSENTIIFTVLYTKTTDTTTTALTTPGAYDINFPNTWPENKEIFFGNGAYGYRATGTFNTTTDTRESTLLLSLTRTSTTKFISQGGTIKRSVVSPTSSDIAIGGPFVSYNLANGIASTPFYAVSIEADGIKLWRRDATMSNIPYDLWFTYTK